MISAVEKYRKRYMNFEVFLEKSGTSWNHCVLLSCEIAAAYSYSEFMITCRPMNSCVILVCAMGF